MHDEAWRIDSSSSGGFRLLNHWWFIAYLEIKTIRIRGPVCPGIFPDPICSRLAVAGATHSGARLFFTGHVAPVPGSRAGIWPFCTEVFTPGPQLLRREAAGPNLSLLARGCGGPQKLRELLKAGDTDGLVRAVQTPRRRSAARCLATLSSRTWLQD